VHIIDRYAYSNKIRGVDPAQKAGLALLMLLLCLLLNEPAVGLLTVAWMWGLAVGWAGLAPRVFGRVLLAELLFLGLATIGVALSVSLTAPVNPAGWGVAVGPLHFSSDPESMQLAANLVLRALGAASTMNFLALTTPLVDLVDLMRRWRVPELLIDLATLMYRFIFVLLESLERMLIAQESRLGYRTYRRGMISAGLLGSQLFIDAYRRSQRLQTALEARGYDGVLRVLPGQYRRDPALLRVGLTAIVTLGLGWIIF
jgi:cobalt/nickel transport system permease protein